MSIRIKKIVYLHIYLLQIAIRYIQFQHSVLLLTNNLFTCKSDCINNKVLSIEIRLVFNIRPAFVHKFHLQCNSVTIPVPITSISEYTFRKCTNITGITNSPFSPHISSTVNFFYLTLQ